MGATEESLSVWKMKVDERVRGLLGDSTAALGTQAFSRIRDTTIDQIQVAPPDEQTVWQAAVLAEMNVEQRAKWRMEIDERHRFKFKGIASLILSEFDRKVSISVEQWNKLEPMIAANTIEIRWRSGICIPMATQSGISMMLSSSSRSPQFRRNR